MPARIQFEDRKIGEILADIRANSPTERDKGTNFELLFRGMAPRIPELEIREIWNWADWPGLTQHHGIDARDDGIDLVAETTGGTLVAIQCKCYADDYKVGKDDIKSFITAANPQIFPPRWFVAPSECNSTAEKSIARNEIRVSDFRQHLDLEFAAAPKPPRRPWQLQQEAINGLFTASPNQVTTVAV